MCFSATASFVSAAGLAAIGMAIQIRLKKQGDKSISSQAIAILPLIFGFHQLIEGFVWLGLTGTIDDNFVLFLGYLYVFIAFTFWPIYIPFAIITFNQCTPKIWLVSLQVLGLLVGGYLFYVYVFYDPVEVFLACGFYSGCHGIIYSVKDPLFSGYMKYPYLIAVTIPFFLCSNTRVRYIIGPAVLLSFPLGLFLSEAATFPSVWCFIAALLSGLVFFVLRSESGGQGIKKLGRRW